jgi:hypothetical protein
MTRQLLVLTAILPLIQLGSTYCHPPGSGHTLFGVPRWEVCCVA